MKKLVILLLFVSCQKEIQWPEETGKKIKPQPCECYISKKLVRQDTIILNGVNLTRFDVDTSYYLDADCKIIGPDSLFDNAGVVNIEPYQFCSNINNYSTVLVHDTMSTILNNYPAYLLKIKTVSGQFIWLQVNSEWYQFAQNGSLENFMYN